MKSARSPTTVSLGVLCLLGVLASGAFAPSAEARLRGYRGGHRYPRFQPASLPAVSTSDLNAARQELIAARAELGRRQGEFDRLFAGGSAPLSEALAALRDAQLAHERADAVVADSLEHNPDFKAALAYKADIERRLGVLRDSGAGNAEQITGMATEAMSWGQRATRIQGDAESGDPNVVQTKAALVEAARRVAATGGIADQTLRSDPQWQAAKQALDAAKTSVAAAESRVAGAQQSLAIAGAAYDRAAVYNQRHGFYNRRAQRR